MWTYPERHAARTDGDATTALTSSTLMAQCMGNAAVALLVLERFEEQLQGHLAQIERSLSDGAAPAVGRAAHAIKGAAGAVGAQALRDVVTGIEASARQERLDAVASDLDALRTEVVRCLEDLPRVRCDLRDGEAPHGAEDGRIS